MVLQDWTWSGARPRVRKILQEQQGQEIGLVERLPFRLCLTLTFSSQPITHTNNSCYDEMVRSTIFRQDTCQWDE